MAFLDNSGDIILDAVLTDTGRYRLAKGDGSFRIVKFALGDDEINYKLYDKNNTSGSAYYDLSILQTPILEAFTDNAASLKSKLVSISRNSLLYLPVIKLYESNPAFQRAINGSSAGSFLIAVDEETEDAIDINTHYIGLIKGATGGEQTLIRLDQGLDTKEMTPALSLDPDLRETQYIIEIDNRLGKIVSRGGAQAAVSYIDDDNIASYIFSFGTDESFVGNNNAPPTTTTNDTCIAGPRGTVLQFSIRSSQELNTSTFLFDQLGAEETIIATDNTTVVRIQFIDSTIRVMGGTTGYRVDIPVRFIKQKIP